MLLGVLNREIGECDGDIMEWAIWMIGIMYLNDSSNLSSFQLQVHSGQLMMYD